MLIDSCEILFIEQIFKARVTKVLIHVVLWAQGTKLV